MGPIYYYRLQCTIFDHQLLLILNKIIKLVSTRCHILRLYTKFDFGGGSVQTPLGELTALPHAPSWI